MNTSTHTHAHPIHVHVLMMVHRTDKTGHHILMYCCINYSYHARTTNCQLSSYCLSATAPTTPSIPLHLSTCFACSTLSLFLSSVLLSLPLFSLFRGVVSYLLIAFPILVLTRTSVSSLCRLFSIRSGSNTMVPGSKNNKTVLPPNAK